MLNMTHGMSIDITTERLLSPTEAAREPVFRRRGKPIHVSCVYRYMTRGVVTAHGERMVLESIRTPMGVRTSAEAIERFIRALTGKQQSIATPTPRARRKQSQQAEEELIRHGFEVGGGD
jgi:hypothetical protein